MKKIFSTITIILYTTITLSASGLICLNCITSDICCSSKNNMNIVKDFFSNNNSSCCKKELKKDHSKKCFETCECESQISSKFSQINNNQIEFKITNDQTNKYNNNLFVFYIEFISHNLSLSISECTSKNLSRLHLKQDIYISINSFII